MTAIEVISLTKEYRLGAMRGLKQTLLNTSARLMGRKIPERPLFKALDDINFSIEQGEVVGIIGHNGAGKSTLLKMLARISTPSSGSVTVNGRIAPLIEVGAGFVPDFTGRENVYLNGSILGLSKKEIDDKFDEIVDFAEMAEFIDTPVKRYSSGMQIKLAFSVATSISAEILIVDEVLAVGDLAFQRKCFDKMEDMIKRQGRTVLLVSHNLRQVQRLCNRVLLMNHGKIQDQGEPERICDLFYQQNNEKIASNAGHNQSQSESSGILELTSVTVLDSQGKETNRLQYKGDCTIQFTFQLSEPLHNATFGFGFHTTDFLYLTTHNSEEQLHIPRLNPGIHTISSRVKNLPLLPGVYSIRFGVTSGEASGNIFYGENLKNILIEGNVPITVRNGFFAMDASWNLASQ